MAQYKSTFRQLTAYGGKMKRIVWPVFSMLLAGCFGSTLPAPATHSLRSAVTVGEVKSYKISPSSEHNWKTDFILIEYADANGTMHTVEQFFPNGVAWRVDVGSKLKVQYDPNDTDNIELSPHPIALPRE